MKILEKIKIRFSLSGIRDAGITSLLLSFLIIISINVIGYFLFMRFDLTSERRYTISESTKKILKGLDDAVYFEVFLDGEFPAGFKRLRSETKEMLDQFRAYSDNIEYEFINPSASGNMGERNNIYQRLVERGLNPTDLQVKTKDGTSRQIIFPGAIATYKNKEIPVELLVSQRGVPPEEVLNNSIQNLEFVLVDAIRKLSVNRKPKVAFIEGHGELGPMETADIAQAFTEYYAVERVKIDGQVGSLTERVQSDSNRVIVRNKFNAIVIAKPDTLFSEKDKFIIDQYIMNGGRVLWLVDPVYANMDSIQFASSTMGLINELNLDDMFFRYGVRLNTNLVLDMNALPIPLKTGQVAGQPQIEYFPWYYFPMINATVNHPVVRNLNVIKTEFISSIDTVKAAGIKKTLLLTSSAYSRTVNTPALITLDILRDEPDKRLFNQSNIPVAYLLEGTFESLFKGRIPQEIAQSSEIRFMEKSPKTKMIIIADGDVIKNQVRMSEGKKVPYPLGYDRYTGQSFGNKDLILNAMNYLVEESGIINIRSREVKLRLLDKSIITENRLSWQLFNTITPLVLIMLLGIAMFIIRRRKYGRYKQPK